MGIKTERFGHNWCGNESAENRYVFDFDLCSVSKGWAQVDTAQDAIYFGTWAHPKQFKTVSFAEGDTCIKTADTVEEFKTMIEEMVQFYVEHGSWKGIDPGLKEENIQAWRELGLEEYLH